MGPWFLRFVNVPLQADHKKTSVLCALLYLMSLFALTAVSGGGDVDELSQRALDFAYLYVVLICLGFWLPGTHHFFTYYLHHTRFSSGGRLAVHAGTQSQLCTLEFSSNYRTFDLRTFYCNSLATAKQQKTSLFHDRSAA